MLIAYCAASCRVVIDNDSCDNATVIRVSLDLTFMEDHSANYISISS